MSSKILAISGGSGSGKTTLAKKVREKLGVENCAILYQDSYYIDQSNKFDIDGGAVNFDHPDAIDFELMAQQIQNLKKGLQQEIPIYDFATHKRKVETISFSPKKTIILDGILILSQEKIRLLCDEIVFIEVDEELRFQRRLNRDVKERGRTPEGVKNQFMLQVKPMHDKFVESSKIYADYLLKDEKEISDYLSRF